jgi:hypothetical protein
LFQREDPLVMFELMHGPNVNEALIDAFASQGHDIYRLVVGLGALCRFDFKATPNLRGLNLFAAKTSRATVLAKRQLLVDVRPDKVDLDRRFANEFFAKAPFAKLVRGRDLPASIAWFCMSKSHPELPVRAFALDRALEIAERDVRERPSVPRRLTLARVALEAGDKRSALAQLQTLISEIDAEQTEADAPFLPPLPRYDTLTPMDAIGPFMAAATVESAIRTAAYSGFFHGPEQLQLHAAFAGFPYPEPEMQKRFAMAKARLEQAPRYEWG